MRALVLIGLVLIALGGFLFYDGSYKTSKQVLEVGGVKVTTREEHQAPTWVAGAVALVGAGLVIVGAGRRKS